MGNKIKDTQVQPKVQYDAYHFEKSIKAKTLHNSSGSKQGRLHLVTHVTQGKDIYAVAAKVMKFKNDETPKLGWWDRQFNILVELPSEDSKTTTWYKINKQSFVKRFNPSEKLTVDKNTGICSNLGAIVATKNESLKKFEAISNAKTPFEKAFLNQLSDNIQVDRYKKIIFYDFGSGISPLDDLDETGDHSILVINYFKPGSKRQGIISTADKRLFKTFVGDSQYKKILSGKPISKALIETIKDEKLGLPKGSISISPGGQYIELEFDSDTRLSDLKNLLDDAKSKFYKSSNSNQKLLFKIVLEDNGDGKPKKLHYTDEIHDVSSVVARIKQLQK